MFNRSSEYLISREMYAVLFVAGLFPFSEQNQSQEGNYLTIAFLPADRSTAMPSSVRSFFVNRRRRCAGTFDARQYLSR
jgi:hypothetical protein